MIRYRLTESIFDNVETKAVSTSDINSESMIGWKTDEPSRHFRFRLTVSMSCTVDRAGRTLGIKEAVDDIVSVIRSWNRFRSAGNGVPVFYVGGVELMKTGDDFRNHTWEIPYPYDETAEVPEVFRLSVDIYFNAIKKSDFRRFIYHYGRLGEAMERLGHSIEDDMSAVISFDELKGGEYVKMAKLKMDQIRELYIRATESEEPAETVRQLVYDRYLREGKEKFLEKIRNVGTRIARTRFGLDMDIVAFDIPAGPQAPAPGYDNKVKASIIVSLRSTEGNPLKMDTVERCIVETVLWNISREAFAFMTLLIGVVTDETPLKFEDRFGRRYRSIRPQSSVPSFTLTKKDRHKYFDFVSILLSHYAGNEGKIDILLVPFTPSGALVEKSVLTRTSEEWQSRIKKMQETIRQKI